MRSEAIEHAARPALGVTEKESRASPRGGSRRWIARHPVAAFFVGAYGFSWLWWTPAVLGLDGALVSVAFLIGGFGPAVSGATVVRLTGGSSRSWFRGLFRWRVPTRWYLFALGLPSLVVAVASVAFILAGERIEPSLLDGNLARFVPLLIFVTLLGGGNEEPGWRGFALPRLQARSTPVSATLLLGTVWAVWHLPLLVVAGSHGLDPLPFALVVFVTFVGIAGGYAFSLTFLYNRTHSTFLCMLLHGSFNTSVGLLVLVPEDRLQGATYATVSLAITGTLLLVTAVLVIVTHGRLGLAPATDVRTGSAATTIGRGRGPAPTTAS
jgi:membrane protease YdiL (CAAX protease family)